MPRPYSPSLFPFSAAMRSQRTPSVSSLSTPLPRMYMSPTLAWAASLPFSAAFRYQKEASLSLRLVPSPCSYRSASTIQAGW